MGRPDVAIIIPAFNEEKTIEKVVLDAMPYGQVIVVDDGSNDQTAMKARQKGAIVVSHMSNQGYDRALNTGFLKASELDCKYAITFDADGEHNPILIQKIIDLLESSVDLVIGVRSRKNRILEQIFAVITNLLYGVRDPFCGMKGYRIKLYRDQGFFDSHGSVGTQLMFYAIRRKYSFAQVPVVVSSRKEKSRFGGRVKGNYRLLKAMLHIFGA